VRHITRLILFLALSACVAASAIEMSLKEAVDYAVSHSPGLGTAQTQADISELQRKIVLTQFFPSVDFSATHGFEHNIPALTTTDPLYSSVGLTAKETLYDNGISILQYGQSKVNRDYAFLNADRSRDQLSLAVSNDFYAFSLAQQNRDISAEQLKALEKQFLAVSDMYQQGFKTRADFLRLKTQVQRGKIDLIAAETALTNSVIELRKSVASSRRDADLLQFTAIDPQDVPIDVPSTDVEPEKTYEYRLAEIQAKSTAVNIDIAKRNYYPQVNLSGGGAWSYAGYIGTPGPAAGNTGWNLLLSVNYNIFDWGLRRNQVELSEAQQLVQENSVVTARITSKAALDTIMQNLKQLKSDYDLSKELLQLEKENYALIKQNYTEGKVQYLDLISSLEDLFSAKQAFVSAAFGLAQNVAQYRYYEGTLYANIQKG
jgi:outer membrane protein